MEGSVSTRLVSGRSPLHCPTSTKKEIETAKHVQSARLTWPKELPPSTQMSINVFQPSATGPTAAAFVWHAGPGLKISGPCRQHTTSGYARKVRKAAGAQHFLFERYPSQLLCQSSLYGGKLPVNCRHFWLTLSPADSADREWPRARSSTSKASKAEVTTRRRPAL